MQDLHSPLAYLLQQHHAGIHRPAVSVRSVPQRSILPHGTIVAATEAPVKREAIDTQHTAEPTNSNGHRRRRPKQLALKNSDSQISQLESLRLLEWPELCQQVGYLLKPGHAATFCGMQDALLAQEMYAQTTRPICFPKGCLDAAPSCKNLLPLLARTRRY